MELPLEPWKAAIFRTEPAERDIVAAAVRLLYESLKHPAPEYILWFDSPADCVTAHQILILEQDQTFFRKFELQSSKPSREAFQAIRQKILTLTGLPSWDKALGTLISQGDIEYIWLTSQLRILGLLSDLLEPGPRHYARFFAPEVAPGWTHQRRPARGDDDPLRGFQEDVDEVDWTCFYGQSVVNRIQLLQTFQVVNPSSVLNISGISFGQLARFEVLARDGHTVHPAWLAMGEIAKQTSLWWTHQNAIILCETPKEIYRNAKGQLHRRDGPAMVYRDGWTVYALNGVLASRAQFLARDEITLDVIQQNPDVRRKLIQRYGQERYKHDLAERKQKPHPILQQGLPEEANQRLAVLRDAAEGTLPLYERYCAGEHTAVWNDLRALGDKVRRSAAPDALAVAFETMGRVKRNLERLTERLKKIHYEFFNTPLDEPGIEVPKLGQRVNLPLSLRAFYEAVGSVNFIGDHDSLSCQGGLASSNDLLTDPLVVYSLEDSLRCLEENKLPIAPDRYHKHGFSGGGPYEISLPCYAADALVEGEANELQFVDYLRLCMRYGGFPGFTAEPGLIPEREMGILLDGLEVF